MTMNEKNLTKGQLRKLGALRKSLGTEIADEAFTKWMKKQALKADTDRTDQVAEKLTATLDQYKDDKSFNLGRKGYIVTRSKGRGARGFVAKKVE